MTSFTAKRLPIHAGPAAWNTILGGQPTPKILEHQITADFVVIGGGFAGLSAARRLRQLDATAKIVVLDAGRLAEGAAGRNSGFMIDLPHELTSQDYAGAGDDLELIRLNRLAIAFGQGACDAYGIPSAYFDRAGKINGAVSAKAHANSLSYQRHLTVLGEASELLDAKQMAEITGSTHYQSGLFTSGTVMLQPAGYIRGLGAGLVQDGVHIYENSPVLGFRPEYLNWRVDTSQGTVRAPKVILATNGHLESFGVEQGNLMQVFLFASMTPDLPSDVLRDLGGQPRWGVTPSDPMGTTVRRIDSGQGGNRIVTRTCAKLLPQMRPTAACVARAAKVQQNKFDQRFPKLAGMKMEYTWAGHLCLSRNGVSVARPIAEGVFSACVQNGLGTTRGTLTGIAAAEMAYGHDSAITRFFQSEEAPKPMPPRAIAKIGANAVMRWKEWRAADE